MDNGAISYRRFLDGDTDGFVDIVKEYKDGLTLFLETIVGNLSAAEELAEDTFVKLGVKRPHFSGKSSFRTWLYAIGRNLAIDALRKQHRRETVPLEDCIELAAPELPETEYLREERRMTVYQAMRRLRADDRQALWLIYFEGFSYREAAGMMKKTTHSLETLAYRARQALKSELIREGFPDEDL